MQVLGTSKKSMEVRRAEVLGSGLGSLAGRLLHLCTHKADALLRNPIGSGVLVEVATGGEGGGMLTDAHTSSHADCSSQIQCQFCEEWGWLAACSPPSQMTAPAAQTVAVAGVSSCPAQGRGCARSRHRVHAVQHALH